MSKCEDYLGLRSLFVRKRYQLGLGQIEMSRRYGVSRGTYAYWECGMTPTIKHIPIVCKILEITPNEVFGWIANAESKRDYRQSKKNCV